MSSLARGAVLMCYLVVIGAFVWLCRKAARTNTSKVKSAIAAWWHMFPLERTRSHTHAESLKVQQVLAEMRESRSDYAINLSLLQLLVSVAIDTGGLHAAGVWSDGADIESLRETLFFRPTLRNISVLTVAALCLRCSRVSCGRAMQFAFVVASACQLWLVPDVLHLVDVVRVSDLGRVLCASLLGRPVYTMMLSIVFASSSLARRLTSEGIPDFPLFAPQSVFLETGLAFVTERVMRSTAHATVDAMSASSSEAAMKELLDIMCDAVVDLNENLTLTASSPTLDALLLRLPRVEPELFTSLLCDTEQARFVEFAERRDSVAQSLHVIFRGERGLRLRAQLYHKRFEDVAGRKRHLIGIVEDAGGVQQEIPPLSSRDAAMRRSASRQGDEEDASAFNDSGFGETSSTASSSETNYVPITDADVEE